MNINEIKHNLKTNIPVFKAGDTVRVKVKVVEGDNERLQAFDGVVIARRGSGISETFTVRKISFGVGVERIFPIHSPRRTQAQTALRCPKPPPLPPKRPKRRNSYPNGITNSEHTPAVTSAAGVLCIRLG